MSPALFLLPIALWILDHHAQRRSAQRAEARHRAELEALAHGRRLLPPPGATSPAERRR